MGQANGWVCQWEALYLLEQHRTANAARHSMSGSSGPVQFKVASPSTQFWGGHCFGSPAALVRGSPFVSLASAVRQGCDHQPDQATKLQNKCSWNCNLRPISMIHDDHDM
eukprot:5030804-Amphidinium_carterae.1